uniref:Histamine responsive receptor n=1 Tax=Schistosoma mansoni TaxID=6183 RepID=C8CG40_SCHMA|nr:histamine responsive receptor [Schistosoma mansoni]
MKQVFLNDNSFRENEYRMETCHANVSCTLSSTNSNFINDLVNLTKVESEMFSEWRFAFNIIIISLQILSDIFIFGGNLLVISAVVTTKGLRRITDLYIVSLALADLLVAVLVLPLSIMRQGYGYWPYESHELCIYWLSLNVFLCSASILNLCCISVDRYIAINYPMKYISKRTRRTAFLMIGGAWIISLLVMVPPIFGLQHHTGVGRCYIRTDAGYRFLTGICIFFVPFLLVGFIYIRIFWVIHRRSRELEFGKFSSNPEEHRFGSFRLLFNPNNIYRHRFVRIKRYLSSVNSNQLRLFVSKCRQCKLCIACTPCERRNNLSKFPVTQSYSQSSMNSFSNERAVQPEWNVSETPKQHTKFIPMFRITMLRRTTKSDLNDFSMCVVHESTENTEAFTSPTAHTKDDIIIEHSLQAVHKTTDASLNDQQNSPQHKNVETQNSQITQNVAAKLKHSNTHTEIQSYRHERLIFNREQKTVKTVATVVCCFILCWLPFAIFHLVEGVCECILSERITMATAWPGYLNSMCNPFIYAFCTKEYASAFKRLLHIGRNI